MSFRFAQAGQRGASGFSFTQSSGQDGTNMAADSGTNMAANNSKNDDEVDTKMAAGVFTCIGEKESRERFTDFTVVVQDVIFRCHRFILSACSKFFEALLRTDMKETSEGTVALGGMEPATFSLILDVLYAGANILTTENMFVVWHAANQLQIDFLIKTCEEFVIKNMTSSNCWTVYDEATKLDSAKVLRDVRKYLAVNLADVIVSDSIMCLSLDDIIGILQHQSRTVCTDFSVFCLLRWACAETDSIRVLFKATHPHHVMMKQKYNHQGTQEVTCIPQLSPVDTETAVYRRSCLSQLLDKVDLTQASVDCLTYLMTNEFVADHRDAILRVNRASAQRFGAGAHPHIATVIGATSTGRLGTCKHCQGGLVYQ
ncbi:kelch repeat and BTB domain-containing protein 3-like [Physella acuta]|uniref:kelch repeat and BTB domain-containing protein 3-like n=1 Tax=Physella acuta TaxID=109671 RepID=UPI0027DE3AA7|nr:kelch repeat and BTB domain-containing protein 3-like [Physella acuta]